MEGFTLLRVVFFPNDGTLRGVTTPPRERGPPLLASDGGEPEILYDQ